MGYVGGGMRYMHVRYVGGHEVHDVGGMRYMMWGA